MCAMLQKFKAEAGEKSRETLGKGSTKTAWKSRDEGFFIARKISFSIQEMSWTVILKIPVIFVSQLENKVLCHSVFLCLGCPVALRELLVPR